MVLTSTQFAHCNNVSTGVPSLSNLPTSEPDGQNGAPYKTQTASQQRVISLHIEVTVLQRKGANAMSFTTVRKLWPSHIYFRKTHIHSWTELFAGLLHRFSSKSIQGYGKLNSKFNEPPPPPAKYDCRCADFHETRNRSTVLCKLLCRNEKQFRR
jgi:hypothetical protein